MISSLIYCSSEDANRINIYDIKTSNVEDEAVISKDSFISQINTSILNYENTGVNFYIETDKSLTRSALNGEYQKIKQRIEDDMLNDIVCTLLSVPCAIMNAASAIGKC